MKIYIFEQDAFYEDDVSEGGGVLSPDYLHAYFSYCNDEVITHELVHEDDKVVIFQSFKEDGDSWKFIGVK